MIRALFSAIFAAIYMASVSVSYAGAWNQAKGDGQIILTTLWSDADGIYDNSGDLSPITDFSKTETRLFFEHGLTDRWTLTGNAAYQALNFDSPQSQFTFKDFDQTELGLRYQIKRRKGLAISAQASYILDGGPQDNILDIGGDRDLIELRGLLGQSIEQTRYGDFFYDAQIAARIGTNARYDSTYADLTLGWKPSDKWMLMVQNYAASAEPESDLGFTVNRQTRLKTQASVTYHYGKRQSLQLGYVKTLAGKNIVAEEGVTLGVWWRY